jgi:hypothetical protein
MRIPTCNKKSSQPKLTKKKTCWRKRESYK